MFTGRRNGGLTFPLGNFIVMLIKTLAFQGKGTWSRAVVIGNGECT